MAKKYIDADLLRKEIESRMGECDANSKNPNQLLWAELAALLPFIDSLQQEQPCEGYDEAYLQEKIALKEKHGSWKDGIKQLEYLNKIYFKEQPCEDLEAEIKRYEASLPESATVDPFEGHPTLEDVARHFAEWQKDQMLKNAVKGTVCKDKKCVWIEFIPNALPDYEDIEPVKCVVIKED